jgi:hypothetical protein
MNKFNKLAQLNKDIDLLEANEKFKAASILHDKFIRLAQKVYPSNSSTREDRAPILNPGFDTSMRIRDYILEYAKDIKRLGNKASVPKTINNLKEQDFIEKVKQGQIDPDLFDENTVQDYAFILSNQANTTSNQSAQVMNEDYLFTVIKSLADQFEDFIQDAILGRDTNNSLGLAKNFIDRVEKYVGPKYSQRLKDYANAQLDIMRKRFADMYQKYHVNDNPDQSSKPSSFGKLSDSDEVAMYATILRQIKALLRRKNIPAAMKLSDQYRNWFSDETLNKTFQANVDNLLSTFVDNENTNQPASTSADSNKTNQSESKSNDPLNQELFNIVSNYFTNRFGQISSDEMWTKAKDPVYKNALRNKIKLKNNPALLALFERKVS